MRQIIMLSLLVFLSGCEKAEMPSMLYQIKKQPFSIVVPAKGELFAAKATVISAPVSQNNVQNIAWLAPEFSLVKKGDVIVRFDGEAMEIKSQENQNEMAIIEQDIVEKNGAQNQALAAIYKDISMVEHEKAFAEEFNIDDVRLRSKLEIIDSLQNTAYLGSKQAYLHWKSDSFNESAAGDMGLLQMKRQQKLDKVTQLTKSLSQLEIKAPHDGLLSYKANWRGEKPRAGQPVWAGNKIAELPDIKQMKAKIFVLESEAIGLAIGNEVTLQLYAHMNMPFSGKVTALASFPNSIKRGDPQKFFEVEVALSEQNPALFVPGRKLQATILVSKTKERLTVPLQAVFTQGNRSFVYLYENSAFKIAQVELGLANLSHVEITSGLQVGQSISLINQEHS